jgi:hypothetical protein
MTVRSSGFNTNLNFKYLLDCTIHSLTTLHDSSFPHCSATSSSLRPWLVLLAHPIPFWSIQRTASVPAGPLHVAAKCSTDSFVVGSVACRSAPFWRASFMPEMEPILALWKSSEFGLMLGSLECYIQQNM